MSCHMCLNAYVDPNLTHDNDLSFHTIGKSSSKFRLMFRSGAGRPTEILFEEKALDNAIAWHLVGFYQPAYCPNCGRKLIENEQREEG